MSKTKSIENRVDLFFKRVTLIFLAIFLITTSTLTWYINVIEPSENLYIFYGLIFYSIFWIVAEALLIYKIKWFYIIGVLSLIAISIVYWFTKNWVGLFTTWIVYFLFFTIQYFKWKNKKKNQITFKNFNLGKTIYYFLIGISLVFIFSFFGYYLNIWIGVENYPIDFMFLWWNLSWAISIASLILLVNGYWFAIVVSMIANFSYLSIVIANIFINQYFLFNSIFWILTNSFYILIGFVGIVEWKYKDKIIQHIIRKQR